MTGGPGSKNKDRLSTSKPFCDCRHCNCEDCPDVMQKLAISIKDSKVEFRGRRAQCKKCGKDMQCKGKSGAEISQPSEHRPSILDMLSPDRDCNCEIMARAIRSHIHMNMGLTARHAKNSDVSEQRPSNSKDID